MTKSEDNTAGIIDEILGDRLQPMEPIPTGMTPGGSLRHPLSGILFDVYGTLLISGTGDISIARESAQASEALRGLLERYQVRTEPETLLETFFSEIRRAHEAAKQMGSRWPEVQIEQIWSRVLDIHDIPRAKRFAMAFEIMANPVWPMPGLDRLLAACREARMPMGIISNAQFYTPIILQWFLKMNLTDLGFEDDLLIYSYKAGCAKPSPALFELAASRLEKRGILPGSVLYMGNDETKDIRPATAAGFQTALFAGDARSLRRIDESPRADLVITNLEQLLPHIQNQPQS